MATSKCDGKTGTAKVRNGAEHVNLRWGGLRRTEERKGTVNETEKGRYIAGLGLYGANKGRQRFEKRVKRKTTEKKDDTHLVLPSVPFFRRYYLLSSAKPARRPYMSNASMSSTVIEAAGAHSKGRRTFSIECY